jgi:tetratricopeptide (TPR) repeat protein/predicted Ser/Thr protein kinase
MDSQPHDGGRVGSWVLERELGRGGFGSVHRARHAVHGTPAAVKLIVGATEPDDVLRVEREAQALARVQHPGIVRLLDHGRIARGWFLVMELVDGVSLDEVVRRGGPLAPMEAARLIESVARACEQVHAAGLVHRDVKPQNVVIGADGQPRLIDFGLVRSLDPLVPSLTATGVLVGTPTFMAPEQVTAGRVDARADIYGLGGTLFYALTGEVPFRGTNPVTVLTAVLHQQPDRPSAFVSSVPAALDQICGRCLEKDPALRYDSAHALAKALASARRPARRPAREGNGRVVGVSVGVLALGGLAAALIVTSGEPPVATTTTTTTARTLVAPPPIASEVPPPAPTEALPATEPAPAASPWRERGLAALKASDYHAAMAAFDRALEDDPRDVLSLRRRGGIKLALGDHPGALVDLDHAVELGPDDVWTYAHQGLALQGLRSFAAARRAYDRALALDPTSSIALTNRGIVREALGDDAGAMADLTRAIELAPDAAAALVNRASLHLRRKDARAARADLDAARALMPDFVEAIFNQGMVRAQLDLDLAGAVRDWSRVLELQPDYLPALDSRATARMQLRDLVGARTDLDRALELDPRSGRLRAMRGVLRTQQGDPGGLEDLERALTLLAPNDPMRAQVEAALAEGRRLLGR